MKRFLKEAEIFDTESVLHYIAEISQFHRIQGSKELPEAAEYIREELRIWGINAEILEEVYDGERHYLTLKSPIAWDLIHGEVEIEGRKYTAAATPLIVMAHSPAGEAEGEVIYVSSEEDWKKVSGKIVLVDRKWKEAYERANKNGALGFIAFREGTGKAFPYIGLFLTKKDLEWAGIPAVTLSEEEAKRIIGKLRSGEKVKARIKVDAEIRERQILPVLYAEIGKPPFILFTAHLCHPKPGANDNASGSAMLMELAKILKGLYDASFRFGFAFLWIPEHFGTQAFIEKYADLGKYYTVINLDMVGGSEDRANSTIMVIRTPLSRFSIVSGLLEYFINGANSAGEGLGTEQLPLLRVRSYSYTMGSDHDIFNFFGVPSVMPITWPDRFYHSSEDSIEKISKTSLEVIGRAVLATALALAKAEKEELQRFARGYAMKHLGELGMEGNTEIAERLVMMGLARDSKFLGIESGYSFEPRPWLEWRKKGIISLRFVRELDEKAYEELKELTREKTFMIHLHELIMLGELLPEEEAFTALQEEYGRINREKLKKAVRTLEALGIISVH
ncbi:DUF4910 domain-containing protein [Thermococcus sp.]